MLKTKAIIESKIGERTYQLECAPDSPLGEIYDALCAMRGFIIQRMQEAEKPCKEEQNG